MDEVIDLSSQNLQEVSASIIQSNGIKKLILDYNDIKSIPIDFCQKITSVYYLSFNGNNLESLPNEIDQIKELSELFLKENLLYNLPENICNLHKLSKLHITGNQISEFPQAFHELCNLSELIADENSITSLPPKFGNLCNLTFLDLGNNSLQYLPDSFGLLRNLKEIDISCNCLKCLPESFKNLPNLEIVNLTNNDIKSVPNTLLSAKSIKKFLINDNSLIQLPNWLSEAEKIQELCCGANDLLETPFPIDFGLSSSCMESIDLSGNNIRLLPESFGNLKQLKYLDLGSSLDELERNRFIANGNNLKYLPNSFANLENLVKLELDENELIELPSNFGKLSNLTYIDLSHNNLKNLPDSFCSLNNLKICMLSMNYLVELPADFGLLSTIEDLKLDHNMLTELPKSFKNLVSLISLDLYNNNLKEIPKALSHLNKLKHLDLRENDFGLPIKEIPEIAFEPTYLARKPEVSDTWRGRKRPDINPACWVDSKAENSNDEKLNDNIIYSALTSASSVYRKHGQCDVRQKSPKKTSDVNEENETMHNNVNDMLHQEEDCWDEDIYEEVCKNNQNLDPVEFDTDLSFSNHTSEDQESCSENSSAKFEESDWDNDSSYDIPTNFNRIYRHPVKDVESDLNMFIPSDQHVDQIKITEIWIPTEDGQFDDAEE